MPDHLRSFLDAGGKPVHPSVWETIADALFWLQLFWVFSGFLLMAYLAFKVFPSPQDLRNADSSCNSRPLSCMAEETTSGIATGSENGRDKLIVAGNYRLEAFPQVTTSAKVIKFPPTISPENRRFL
jgi:hypothetical protein